MRKVCAKTELISFIFELGSQYINKGAKKAYLITTLDQA